MAEPRWRRILREPLLHFALLGAAIEELAPENSVAATGAGGTR
jgi:hypothetical protein